MVSNHTSSIIESRSVLPNRTLTSCTATSPDYCVTNMQDHETKDVEVHVHIPSKPTAATAITAGTTSTTKVLENAADTNGIAHANSQSNDIVLEISPRMNSQGQAVEIGLASPDRGEKDREFEEEEVLDDNDNKGVDRIVTNRAVGGNDDNYHDQIELRDPHDNGNDHDDNDDDDIGNDHDSAVEEDEGRVEDIPQDPHPHSQSQSQSQSQSPMKEQARQSYIKDSIDHHGTDIDIGICSNNVTTAAVANTSCADFSQTLDISYEKDNCDKDKSDIYNDPDISIEEEDGGEAREEDEDGVSVVQDPNTSSAFEPASLHNNAADGVDFMELAGSEEEVSTLVTPYTVDENHDEKRSHVANNVGGGNCSSNEEMDGGRTNSDNVDGTNTIPMPTTALAENIIRDALFEDAPYDVHSVNTGTSTLTTTPSLYKATTFQIDNTSNEVRGIGTHIDDNGDIHGVVGAVTTNASSDFDNDGEKCVKAEGLESKLDALAHTHAQTYANERLQAMDVNCNDETVKMKPTSPTPANVVSSNTKPKSHVDQERKEMKEHYEKQLQSQRRTHEEQIDEIIEQLTSIESAYGAEIDCLKDKLSKKEVMTEALTSSLSDLRNKNILLKNDVQSYQLKNEEIIQTYELVVTKLDETKIELDEGQERYRALQKQCNREKMEAVQAAQSEIRSAAESQFALAQQTYMKLKQDYQESCDERNVLKDRVEDLAVQMDSREREQEGQISRLRAELATAKAQLATSEAESLKMKQSHIEQNQLLIDSEKLLRRKVAKAEKETVEARTVVDNLLKEKKVLVAENKELNAVCEELMGMVEGNVT